MKHHASSRRRLIAGTAGLAGLSALGLSPLALAQAKKLVVNTYGGRWEKFWRGELLPPFTKQTGIEPTLDVGLGRNFIANLRAAGVANPPYSVLMINENLANILRSEGYFESIPQEVIESSVKTESYKRSTPACSTATRTGRRSPYRPATGSPGTPVRPTWRTRRTSTA